MKHLMWIALVALGLLESCQSPDMQTVTVGNWGGQNISLQVTQTGATAQLKCGATGAVTQPLALDAAGRFDVQGTYQTPVIQLGPQPARFTGMVSGTSMTLDVTVSNSDLGPFSLHLGETPTFEPCNF